MKIRKFLLSPANRLKKLKKGTSMKTKAITIASLFGLATLLPAAVDYVAQGRAYLAATNLVAANNSFSNAVALSPNDPTGNVFYAATRLLVLPLQSAGSN